MKKLARGKSENCFSPPPTHSTTGLRNILRSTPKDKCEEIWREYKEICERYKKICGKYEKICEEYEEILRKYEEIRR